MKAFNFKDVLVTRRRSLKRYTDVKGEKLRTALTVMEHTCHHQAWTNAP